MKALLFGLVSGFIASLACFWFSSLVLKKVGDRALVTYIPVAEETGKTLTALLLNGNPIASHVSFGIAEALYDLHSSPKEHCVTAALFSLISHSLLGVITMTVLKVSGYPVLAVMIASIIHSLWNRIMTGYTG
jgi:hypothetical protein